MHHGEDLMCGVVIASCNDVLGFLEALLCACQVNTSQYRLNTIDHDTDSYKSSKRTFYLEMPASGVIFRSIDGNE